MHNTLKENICFVIMEEIMRMKLSEDLIAISTMMMVAQERGELIRLSSQLNSVIERAIEMEKAGTSLTTDLRKTSSALIKFTKEEIDKMSKSFKKEFIANGCVAHIIKRPSGKKGFYYEIRYRRNGYNITESNADLKKAKLQFVEATKKLETPESLAKNKTKFGTIIDEWLEYKKGKVSFRHWQNFQCHAKRYFTYEWREKQIKDIRTVDLDRFMRQFDPHMYEAVRTLINQIFKYAQASGIITHNPVTLVPFIRAERKTRRGLTEEEVRNYLSNLRKPEFELIRQIGYIFYFFGVRPSEIDSEAHFENGFLYCRNRKRKGGKIAYKKIPIPKQAQGLIDFNKPLVYPLSYDATLERLKKALGNGLTPYNLRHTFASTCAEAVKPDVLDVWMGDSPERLVGKTYVHFRDDFMKEQMEKVNFIILNVN